MWGGEGVGGEVGRDVEEQGRGRGGGEEEGWGNASMWGGEGVGGEVGRDVERQGRGRGVGEESGGGVAGASCRGETWSPGPAEAE